jgi:hypothetical protein
MYFSFNPLRLYKPFQAQYSRNYLKIILTYIIIIPIVMIISLISLSALKVVDNIKTHISCSITAFFF